MDEYQEIIRKLRKNISVAVSNEMRAASKINRFIKFGVIVLSLVLAVMQFMIPGTLQPPQIVGIGAALGISFLTLASFLYERDHSDELKIASEATQTATELLEVDGILTEFETQLNRADAVILASRAILEFIDRSVFIPERDDVSQARDVLRCCERALMISAGFQTGHHWTICVYKVTSEDHEVLKNVASFRAVPCDDSRARSFAKGEGVPGISWANRRMLVIEDLNDPAHANTFELSAERARLNDKSRYVSNVSIPIMVGEGENVPQFLWGVVTASYDEPDHFGPEGAGARTVTPFRLLAAGIAAAVSVTRQP